MIQLHITQTGKSFNPKDKYAIFHQETKNFPSLADAESFIKDRYGKSKRQAMYKDDDNGKPVKIGYIIGFRNADYSHAPIEHWLQQDWIEFRKVESLVLA